MTRKRQAERVADLLSRAVAELAAAGIVEARSDAELLLSFCLNKSRTGLYLAAQELLTREQIEHFQQLVERRRRREPVAYITGEREFWSYSFRVTPDVLIPRPETEILIDRVLSERNPQMSSGKCLDLCCGSGIIAIVLALELDVEVVGVDISDKALAVCRQNCLKHQVAQKVALVQADLGSCFLPHRPFRLITANPPYIRREVIKRDLAPEVAGHEPHLALDGGEDGLEQIARICRQLPSLLAPGGDFFMEIGAEQAGAVQGLLSRADGRRLYQIIQVFSDYAGRDRVLHVRRNNKF